jgi:membrane-associated protease RseP (regulator of RpoE activity)
MCALERASVLNMTSSLSISLLFLFVLTLNGVSTPSSDNGLRLVAVDSTNQPNAHPPENQATNQWIGIRMNNISSPLVSLLGLNESTGALVTDVTPGSPAQKAGLRVPEVIINSLGQPIEISNADVILKIDNIPVQATTDVGSTLQTRKSGDKITLDVLRDGQINQVTIIPVPKPDYFVFNDPEGLYSIRYPQTGRLLIPVCYSS